MPLKTFVFRVEIMRERERESLAWRGRRGDAIRDAEIQTDELRVTNWRADLRGCNWRCRAMGFAPASKERNVGAARRRKDGRVGRRGAGGRRQRGVGVNLHKASDTRAYKARRGAEKTRKTDGRCARVREGPKKRKTPVTRALFAFPPNEVFATAACTCVALESNDISTISVTPGVHYMHNSLWVVRR